MAGHSKWSTIKNKKGKADAKRGAVFTKLARYISVAAREGGADPEYNAALKAAIEKAKAENMPNDNIERAIKKGAGGMEGEDYESVNYEGYGPEGIAVIVSCLTDNRNRTAGEVRHFFDASGGNLGQTGSVSFMFERKGILWILSEGKDEDEVMMDALEAGASDLIHDEEEIFEVITEVDVFNDVRDTLSKKYSFEKAELSYIPQNYTKISNEENLKKMVKLLDQLEDNDDVQDVYHNWDVPENLELE